MGQGLQEGAGRNPAGAEVCVEADAGAHSWTNAEPNTLMERVLERPNLMRAYQRVVSNKGAAGVDQMPVTALKGHLQQHWPTLRERLLVGDYHPQPIRRVSIPKPQGGGERILGIPTVQDRLIQQALHQTLSPMLEPTFSDHSYGFRPGRSAHQAVKAMQRHINDGHHRTVDTQPVHRSHALVHQVPGQCLLCQRQGFRFDAADRGLQAGPARGQVSRQSGKGSVGHRVR